MRKLTQLADRYSNFEFKDLGNTHAKVLISDSDVYSHVLPSMQSEAAEHLETMLYRKNGTFRRLDTQTAHKMSK